jgi:hypothetical protein
VNPPCRTHCQNCLAQELAHRPDNMQPPDLTQEATPATVADPARPAGAVNEAKQLPSTMGHLCGDEVKGASSEVTGRSTLLCEARWTPFGLTGRKYNQPQRTTVCRLCSSPTSLIVALKLQAVHRSPSPQVAHMHVRRFLDDERPAHCPSSYVNMLRVCCTLQKPTNTKASRATSVGPTADAAPRAADSTNQAGWDASGGSVEADWLRTKWAQPHHSLSKR